MPELQIDEESPSARRPFFIATNQGDISSADVTAIKDWGSSTTTLERRGLGDARVYAPQEVVRDVFREQGYVVIDEDDLKERTRIYEESREPS